MPPSPQSQINRFVQREIVGASRLNELADPINDLQKKVAQIEAKITELKIAPVCFIIDSKMTGMPGYYKVKAYKGLISGPTGAVKASHLTGKDDSVSAIGINWLEVGGSAHSLKPSTSIPYWGMPYTPTTISGAGSMPTLLFAVEVPNAETVKTIGSATEGSETADTTTWVKTTDLCPLEVWFVSRVVYNDAGDQKLYQMMRKATYDSTGKIKSVSGETRVTVDVPESC